MDNHFSHLSPSDLSVIADCRELITRWLAEPCIDDASKKEVTELINASNVKELRDRFYRELEFGTGGLRGVLGAGNNRMNRYIVRRATQGLCNYINKVAGGKSPSIAIAHDSRNFSDTFAKEAACVFAANGIRAYLFPTLQTTPCLSFAIRKLGCISGVCVTASHNPPQYNGFKVYWQDGAQIVPPHDTKILDEVLRIKSFSDAKFVDFESAKKQGLISFIGEEVPDAYYTTLKELQLYPDLKKDVNVVYTPLHGTGALPVRTALSRWGYHNLSIVAEQAEPNGNFPTVKKPNPEEPEALSLAVKLANKVTADIAVATDPDSDRLALVVRDPKAAAGVFAKQAMGEYVLLNGNQTGALLIDYVLTGCAASKKLRPNHKIIKTIVTSDLHARICKKFNIEIFDTLTGFKWIAGLIREWEEAKNGFEYLFGTEESFGFMPGSYVRDKDGVGALCQAVEMVALLKSQGKTACDRLLELFKEHGAWQEDLINFDLVGEAGAARIARIMQHSREKPLLSMAGSAVTKVYDYKLQTISQVEGGRVGTPFAKIELPKSDVLQFVLIDGSKVSMRPSGTEPKLKIYVSVCTNETQPSVESAHAKTLARVEKLRAELEAYIATIP